MSENIGIGVLGVGFMGKTHIQAWNAARDARRPVRLVAVCDQDPERRLGRVDVSGNLDTGTPDILFDPQVVRGYAEPAEIFADEEVDAVSLCTRTDTHVDLAIAALEAGKHVLCEKPVALTSPEVQRLVDAADASDRICMPAMCMRFWPGWRELRQYIDEGTYGAVRSASFQRLGSLPLWSREFYADREKSGGALIDLHIHDADFVRFLFGDPVSVESTGTIDHVTTIYRFDDGPEHVVAEGAWDNAATWDFRMRAVVVFEKATIDFDLLRTPNLVIFDDEVRREIELPETTGYDGEVRHFVDLILGRTEPVVTMHDALAVTRLLEQELASLRS